MVYVDHVQHHAGIVLSHAPLMGADPIVDESHNRWLHIHVRPPVTGMLKVRRAGHALGTTAAFRHAGTGLTEWTVSGRFTLATHVRLNGAAQS